MPLINFIYGKSSIHNATSSEKKTLTKLNIGSIELASFLFLQELDLEITDFENFTRPFPSIKHSLKKKIKKAINDSYSKKTLEKLSSFNETSKLYIYSNRGKCLLLISFMVKAQYTMQLQAKKKPSLN
jgi:hypothetical protein